MDQSTATQPRVSRFAAHPLRGTVLSEAHARPFHAVATPRRVLHLAFLTGQNGQLADW